MLCVILKSRYLDRRECKVMHICQGLHVKKNPKRISEYTVNLL